MALEEKIKGYILENFLFTSDQSALNREDSFLELGIIDSTGILEVITFLEEEFGVSVEDEEMVPENLDTVANLTAFVQHKSAAA